MKMRLEYPRPELIRKEWISLHGEWDFAFDQKKTGKKESLLHVKVLTYLVNSLY